MTANEVITLAQGGVLRQLSTSIKDNTALLTGYINLGMIELYKRFVLKTDEAIVTLQDGKTVYSLDGTDSDVDMAGEFMYLIAAYGDSSEDDYSTDDLILPINSEDDLYSINTISYNQVQIPLITAGAYVSLIYGSKPTKVTSLTLDNELDIPDQLVKPLLEYIGYEAHASMNDNTNTESNVHYQRFEAACNIVRQYGVGIAPDDIDMRSRIDKRCFA